MILAGSLGPPGAAQHCTVLHSTVQYSTVQHYVPLEQQSSSRSPPHFLLFRLPMVQLLTSRSWQVRPCIAATKTSSFRHILMKLQTIHRFSQSRRRSLLALSHLRHYTIKTLCQTGVDPTVSRCEIGSASQLS